MKLLLILGLLTALGGCASTGNGSGWSDVYTVMYLGQDGQVHSYQARIDGKDAVPDAPASLCSLCGRDTFGDAHGAKN